MKINRGEKVKELIDEIEGKVALAALLMGNCNPFIDETYIAEKEKMGKDLVKTLDPSRGFAFHRMFNQINQLSSYYFVKYGKINGKSSLKMWDEIEDKIDIELKNRGKLK